MNNFKVFFQVRVAVGSWDRRDPLLNHPAQDNLSWSSTVLLSNRLNGRVGQYWVWSLLMLSAWSGEGWEGQS